MEMLELVNEEDRVLDIIQSMPEVLRVVEDREKMSCKCTDLASKYNSTFLSSCLKSDLRKQNWLVLQSNKL